MGHRRRVRVLAAELKPAPPPAPELAAGATTADLLAAVGRRQGIAGIVLPRAAEALRQDLGDKSRSWPFLHGLVSKVWSGALPLESVLEPYARTVAALGGPRPPSNAGAYFARSHANWVRERGGGGA